MKQKKKSKLMHEDVIELTGDIEVIGPGQLLKEAREACGLSENDVAEKLNFRLTLVQDIEKNKFDKKLGATFNRGYLRNYAKLVKVSEQDVLVAYEMLDIAEQNGSAMQSFSKGTKKQAENTRIMWLTYFILAIIAGSTVLWWLQENKPSTEQTISAIEPVAEAIVETPPTETPELSATLSPETDNDINNDAAPVVSQTSEAANIVASTAAEETFITANTKVNVSFTFKGDCWVNIYDSTGEHIAWGIKKSGYVMNISGTPPFSITLGKPELVDIAYAGSTIDMSQFAVGNIAKFSLPIQAN